MNGKKKRQKPLPVLKGFVINWENTGKLVRVTNY